MTLLVHAYGAYASYTEPKWRDEDYHVRNVVKALKNEAFKGYSNVRGVDGSLRRIENGARAPALATFAAWAVQRLKALNLNDVVLVPVPSSSQITFDGDSTPILMSKAVAAASHGTVTVGCCLRFTSAQVPSHRGGNRDQAQIEAALAVQKASGLRVVLLDDVKTTGAHLRASALVLRRAGATVEHVLVAGSTVWFPHDTPLSVDPENIE